MFGDLQRSRTLAYTAAFTGLIAVGSWISIPCIPVPFTLQTLFVLLAGAVMKRKAVVPVVVLILLGVLGLPVFHNGLAGIGILLGPTGGYLIGFVAAAFVVGWAYESLRASVRITGLVCGTLLIYAGGVAWLMISLHLPFMTAAATGALPFVIGDAIKAAAAYIIADRLP